MDLREARFKRRKTQWDIQKSTGIRQSKFSLIERGYITPSDEEKRKIAEVLSFKVDEITWGEN
jgi:DNA-binding XRE family transcriptional regulator